MDLKCSVASGLVGMVVAMGMSACAKTIPYPEQRKFLGARDDSYEICGYKVATSVMDYSIGPSDTIYILVDFPLRNHSLSLVDNSSNGDINTVFKATTLGGELSSPRYAGTEKHDRALAALASGECSAVHAALSLLK